MVDLLEKHPNKVESYDILRNFVNYLNNSIGTLGTNSTLPHTVENLLLGVGKILRITSRDAHVQNQNPATQEKGITMTRELLLLKDRMIRGIRNSLKSSPGNKTFYTTYMNIEVVSVRRNVLHSLMLGDNRTGSFGIPDLSNVLKKNANNNEIVFFEMWSTPFNPFTWNKSSEWVTTNVASLDIRDKEEDIITISGLSPGITILLPWQPITYHSSNLSFVRLGSSRRHSISVQHGHSVVEISIVSYGDDFVIPYVRVSPPVELSTQFGPPECKLVQGKWLDSGNITCVGKTNLTINFKTLLPGNYHLDIDFIRKGSNINEDEQGTDKYIKIKEPPKQESQGINYTFTISEVACFFWNSSELYWDTSGCKVEGFMKNSALKCSCNHLTPFGGGYLVAPNEINFHKVFIELLSPNDSGKFLVLVTVATCFLIYLVAVIIARRVDNREKAMLQDREPIIICKEEGSEEHIPHSYKLTVKTGVWAGAGTTSNVSLIIYGVEGNSGILKIAKESSDASYSVFARGTEQNVKVILNKDIGEVYSLRIWHDNSGKDPSWYLDEVSITKISTGTCWKFIIDTWLSLETESYSCEVLQVPSCSGPSITNVAVKEMFSNGHLWLSVVTKTPGDNFTRVQRLSSCVCLLLCTMAISAAFYRGETHSYQVINLGPLKFSARQAMVSVQSTIFTIPVHVIILLFKKTTSFFRAEHSRWWQCLFYGMYIVSGIMTVSSAIVTISYSLIWGSHKSQEWISAVITSFFEDILVVQPCKCLVLVAISVMLAKCKGKKISSESRENKTPEKVTPFPRSGREFSRLKKEIVAKAKRRSSIRQIGYYMTFLVIIGVLSYGNRDSTRYLFAKFLDVHTGYFEQVTTFTSFWEWMNKTLVPHLYLRPHQSNYRECQQAGDELKATVIGMLRLRQLRAGKVECPAAHTIKDWFPLELHDCYSFVKKSKDPFIPKHGFFPCSRPWVYQTAEELDASSKWGHHGWYGGGGYSADLGYDEETARTVVHSLQSGHWIDRQTTAVIVEFTLFSQSISTLAVCSFFFEVLQTGQAVSFKQINTISLHNTESVLQVFQGLCFVIFISMFIYKGFDTTTTIIRRGRPYTRSVWCWLDVSLLCTSLSVLVFSFVKSYHITNIRQHLERNIFAPVNFQSAVLLEDVENCVLATLTFFTTVKLLQLTYFNMYTKVFSSALRIWLQKLHSYLLILSVLFFAFLQTGILLFGTIVSRYSSLWVSFSFQLEIILGKVKARPVKELVEAVPVFGHVFVSLLLFGITIIMMNFFISSLNDAISDARALQIREKSQPPRNQADSNIPTERFKEFFDHISYQLKAIDVIQHLPEAHILDKKLTEVLRRLDEACSHDINE